MSLADRIRAACCNAVNQLALRSSVDQRSGRDTDTARCRVSIELLERRRLLSASPYVVSINRFNPTGPDTGSASVAFTVTFSEAVTGVNASDFKVVTSGSLTTSPLVAVSSLSGSVYTVNVFGIQGSGTLGLNLIDNNTIRDSAGNSLVQPNASPSFAPPQTLATVSKPLSVAVADVNGDGIPDLIVANAASNSVGVMLGNGNGTFTAPQTFATGTYPRSVAVADVNGDSAVDIVTANLNSNNVSVLLGNGNGTFQTQQTFAAGTNPSSIAVVHPVNGTSQSDLLVTNATNPGTVSVLVGNFDGTFQTPTTLATGPNPSSVTVADVNGDGVPDLIVTNSSVNTASVFLGNGNGAFHLQQAPTTGAMPASAAIADVNGDGKPDLIVANYGAGSVGVLLGNGNGTFQAQQTFATGSHPVSVVVSDVNGDGKADVIEANAADGTVGVLLGNGNGTFQNPQTFVAGSGPSSIATADLNADGRPDLVVANSLANNVAVLLANSNGSFTTGQDYTIVSAPSPLQVAVSGNLPSFILAGHKKPFIQTITLTNVTNQSVTESVRVSLYLSTETVFDPNAIALPLSVVKTVRLSGGGHFALAMKIIALPGSVPLGTYHILANVNEPTATAFGDSTATLDVVPPAVTLSGSFASVASVASHAITINVANSGNIAANAFLSIEVQASNDGLLIDAVPLIHQSKRVNIKPDGSERITITHLGSPAVAGPYFLIVQLDPADTFPRITDPGASFVSATKVLLS